MDSNKEKKKLCLKCKKFYENNGFCAIHPYEPLFDISNENFLSFAKETLKNSILKKSRKFYYIIKVGLFICYFWVFVCLCAFLEVSMIEYYYREILFFLYTLAPVVVSYFEALYIFANNLKLIFLNPINFLLFFPLFFILSWPIGMFFLYLLISIWHKTTSIPALRISKKIYPLIYKEPFITHIEFLLLDPERSKLLEEVLKEEEVIEKKSCAIELFIKSVFSKCIPYITQKDLTKIVNEKMNIFAKIIHYFLYYFLFHSVRKIYFLTKQLGVGFAEDAFEDYFNEIIGKK